MLKQDVSLVENTVYPDELASEEAINDLIRIHTVFLSYSKDKLTARMLLKSNLFQGINFHILLTWRICAP